MKNQNGIRSINGLTFIALVIGIIITIPILFILIESIGIKSLNLSSIFSNYLTSTFKLAFYTCLISIIIAVIPAWIISFYEIKYKNLFDLLLILPLSIPSYIMAFTYADLLGYNGLFDIFLQNFFDTKLRLDILTIEWLSIFLALSLYPYIYATTRISFNLIGQTYIDLAKSLGLKKIKTFFKIILPLSIPAIFSGTLLVFMEILNEYGAVNYFGIKTFSVGIFKYWFSMDDKSTAIIFAFSLLIIIMILVGISRFFKKNDNQLKYHLKDKPLIFKQLEKTNSKKLVYTILCLPIIFGLIIPFSFIAKNVKS